jgi:hypothetical protein
MKKIAGNKNYRLMKKADKDDKDAQWFAGQIYRCLSTFDDEYQHDDSSIEHTSGSNEVTIEKEYGKFKITVTRELPPETDPEELFKAHVRE